MAHPEVTKWHKTYTGDTTSIVGRVLGPDADGVRWAATVAIFEEWENRTRVEWTPLPAGARVVNDEDGQPRVARGGPAPDALRLVRRPNPT